ncbi:restriction endonuclease [Pedobacter sp. V48]|uniref:nSTAND3 domain-containing NTPase n=1 Tax=Pedobacter sp. V48 TaxID=509635 RepID=UPI0003E4AB55|nr:restriction endonuclease [Pedobacter sp. V48]ETZ20138.1 hypothetical protein N824_07960 [Pedobacter sp. V48]
MKYNLDVLNDKEFEDLCKELYDIHYGVNFQVFKAGRDGGIDLVFAGKVENEIVVQCKHYINSSYSLLLEKLKNTELSNLKKMSPTPGRYIVATTLPLSPAQARDIKAVLTPYVRNTNDIYGRKRIENLLSRNPEVEKKFFKLWLTSTNVMLNILHHASVYNSEFHRAKIVANTKLYVLTSNFNNAISKLSENKFLIISGAPGVGKTTLAFMLICERLARGYDLVYCDGRIAEVEHAFSDDPLKKQIFFIDDFLGANLHDIKTQKNPENKLISFMQKFQFAKNKYLVLTSRTTILNQAKYDYEHLKNSGLTTLSQYELKLQQYSMLDKATILYNHVFFSQLGKEFRQSFFNKEVYKNIIQHRNYFPRLIQFITDESKYKGSGFKTVKDYIYDKLEHPDEIWEYAFEKQLSNEDRYLLLCLFTLGGNNVPEDQLLIAFESRYRYEIKNNNIQRNPRAFQHSLKKVLNGFVNAVHDSSTSKNLYTFFNPSIVDFLLGYMKGNNAEIIATLSSVVYVEQITVYFDVKINDKVYIEPSIRQELFQVLTPKFSELKSIEDRSCVPLQILDLLQSFFEPNISSIQHIASDLVEKIVADLSFINSGKLSFLIWCIGLHEEWPEVIKKIKTHFERLILGMLNNVEIENDFDHFKELFKIYNQDFSTFLDNNNNKLQLQLKLGAVFSDMIKDIYHDENDLIRYIGEYGMSSAENRVRDHVWDRYIEFVNGISLGDYFDEMDHEYELDASRIVNDIQEQYMNNWDDDDFSPTPISESKPFEDPWVEIDRLFSKN